MPIKTIDARKAKAWLDKGEAVIVDVREPGEHGAQAIPGATLLPLGKVCKSALPDTSGKKLILHCKAGKRGGTACEKLLEEDPNLKLYNLEGGIDAWEKAGFEITKAKQCSISLDRQVQFTIGVVILAGIILGYFTNPGFLIVSGLFAAGLINAGLTGCCGVTLLMAKMPWNRGSCDKGGSCHD
ncbi:rhodanese-like domain-containing protein [Rickettsiales bacterium]|nr:rhodanese-like domain-containing protein [Rickettsiales bacterium]